MWRFHARTNARSFQELSCLLANESYAKKPHNVRALSQEEPRTRQALQLGVHLHVGTEGPALDEQGAPPARIFSQTMLMHKGRMPLLQPAKCTGICWPLEHAMEPHHDIPCKLSRIQGKSALQKSGTLCSRAADVGNPNNPSCSPFACAPACWLKCRSSKKSRRRRRRRKAADGKERLCVEARKMFTLNLNATRAGRCCSACELGLSQLGCEACISGEFIFAGPRKVQRDHSGEDL